MKIKIEDNCIFCKIVAGESESSKFYEDDLVLGFMTIGPINQGHALIIPKDHYPTLSDLPEELGAHLFKITLKTQKAIRKSELKCEGINLWLADGEAAFQDVFHVHMHVFPRFKNDPFKIKIDWNQKPSREELNLVAKQIKELM